jgi:iron complex outermembrane receptor protein
VWAASYLTLGRDVDLDLVARRVGRIAFNGVAAFTDLDARAAYRPRPGLELALIGQNLLRPRHAEFGGGFQVDRAFRVRATMEW